jgi:hypothetical protein
MKIWRAFGSEHSYNMVLIGTFVEERDARAFEQLYERLTQVGTEELQQLDWEDANPRYSDALYGVLRELNLSHFSRTEVEGFAFIEHYDRQGSTVTVRTDDIEIQGLLKLLIDRGARVEIYSAHDWTVDGEPRPRETNDEAAAVAPDGDETDGNTG